MAPTKKDLQELAKNAAEKAIRQNNKEARVLVIACEDTALCVQEIIFGDGAAAVIVGADQTPEDKTLFEIHWAGENVLAGTEEVVKVRLREVGMTGIEEHVEEDSKGEVTKCSIQNHGAEAHD